MSKLTQPFLLLVLLFGFLATLSSQPYRPMAVEGATWIYKTWGDLPDARYVYHISGDTVLNSITYKSVYLDGEWIGYLRDDLQSRKVYGGVVRIPVHAFDPCDYYESDITQEYLLYDFDVTVGDTLRSCNSASNEEPKSIIDDRYKLIYGELLRTLSIDTTWYTNNLIEGIGSYDGLFTNPTEKSISADKAINLIAYCVDPEGNCQTSTKEFPYESHITIYPNPASDILYIESQALISSINIYNLNGQLLSTESSKSLIEISHLAKGVYLLNLSLANNRFYKTRFVKM